MTLEEFYRAMVLQLQGLDPQELIAAVRRENWAREVVGRFAEAGMAQTSGRIADMLAAAGISSTPQHGGGPEAGAGDKMGGGPIVMAKGPSDGAAALGLQADLEAELAAAEVARERDDLPEALRIWDRIRSRFPVDPEAFRRSATALRSAGRLDEAERILREGRAHFPGDVELAVDLGWVAYQRGDTEAALERWAQVSREFPDHPAGPRYVALVFRDSGRYDEAEIVLAAAEMRFSDDPATAADHATLSNVRGDWLEAGDRWDRFRARFPDHPAGYIGGAWAFRGRECTTLLRFCLPREKSASPICRTFYATKPAPRTRVATGRWQRDGGAGFDPLFQTTLTRSFWAPRHCRPCLGMTKQTPFW